MSKLHDTAKDLILDSVIGKMHWHGDTYADEESLENMEAGYELVLALLAGIKDNAMLTDNAKATASGERLNTRAKAMLKDIMEEADLEFEL